jgi:hypothetical protein
MIRKLRSGEYRDAPGHLEHLLLSDAEKSDAEENLRREPANRTVRELAFTLALELGSKSKRR